MSFTDSLTLIKSSAQSAISNAFWIFSPSAFIICASPVSSKAIDSIISAMACYLSMAFLDFSILGADI